MTTIDYIIDIVLVGFVILQVRGGRLTLKSALRPVILVAAAALYYLQGVPTAGHDILLDAVLGGVGLVLGVSCALTTKVWKDRQGFQYSKAGGVAAVLWVVGVGSRMVFEEYSSHGGEAHIANFSRTHDITSQSAWVAALVIMALAEVVSRLIVIRVRAARTTEIAEPLNATANLPVAA